VLVVRCQLILGLGANCPQLHSYSKYVLNFQCFSQELTGFTLFCRYFFFKGGLFLDQMWDRLHWLHSWYSCSVLYLCCQKADGWFFRWLGNINNGHCCCVHYLCELLPPLSFTHTHTHSNPSLFLSILVRIIVSDIWLATSINSALNKNWVSQGFSTRIEEQRISLKSFDFA
jgi:hypothetical protein